MEESTIIPTPRLRPPMDMTFIPKPAAPIIVSAISTDTGMELPTIREAFTFPKNAKSTGPVR